MRDLRRVCHLGYLDMDSAAIPGRKAGSSYEGNGLSISVTPDAWRKIAKLGGSDSYILEKENPRFADGLDEFTKETAIKWCLEAGKIEPGKEWIVTEYDPDGDIVDSYVFMDEHEAIKNAKLFYEDVDEEVLSGKGIHSHEDLVEAKGGLRFTDLGKEYFAAGMLESGKVRHSSAADFAIVFWAEAHGFDGVWWEEDLDANNLSAPRGVIFQGKLNEWNIVKGHYQGNDY